MKTMTLVCLALTLSVPASVSAQNAALKQQTDATIHPLNDIEETVDQFVRRNNQAQGQDVSVSIKSLDNRLRLARCAQPLNTVWSPGSRMLGRVTVQVECISPKPWRIHVQASVTMEGTVWTLARGVRRGDVLTQAMLTQQVVILGSNNAAYRARGAPIVDVEPWLGYTFVQRVSGGQVLEERMLKPANLISKGEVVIISHQSEGLSLQTKGIALKDASANQQVQVRNSASGRIINAIAVARGTVQTMQ